MYFGIVPGNLDFLSSSGWHSADQQKKRKRCGGNFYTVWENATFLFYFGGEGFKQTRRIKKHG